MIKLQYRKGKEVVREVDQLRMSLGRDKTNDIVLNDDRVSGFHANLFYENGILECIDLGSANGTYLNGKMIDSRTELKPWDVLLVGDSEFEIIDTEARRPTQEQPVVSNQSDVPEDSSEPIAFFKLLSSGPYPQEIIIRGRTTVGRSPDNTCIIELGTISSHHAEISKLKHDIEIVDLGSSNGTYVNDEKIQIKMLTHGDRVRFDEVEFRVEIPGQEIDKTTVRSAISKTTVRAAVQDDDIPPAIFSSSPGQIEADAMNQSVDTSNGYSGGGLPSELANVQPSLDHDIFANDTEIKGDPTLPPEAPVVSPSSPGRDNAATMVDQRAVPPPPPPPFVHTHASAHEIHYSKNAQGSGSGISWLFFSPHGRINRLTYIGSSLGVALVLDLIILIIMSIIDVNITYESFNRYVLLGNILFVYPIACLMIKRAHDVGKRGYFLWLILPYAIASYFVLFHIGVNPILVALMFLVSLYPLVVVMFFKGNDKGNIFGPPPSSGFNKGVVTR